VLLLIGYWRSAEQPSWPNPKDFIDPLWHDQERQVVVAYLGAGMTARVARGWSDCRFCGDDNGNREFTDGTYLWPEGLAHYVKVHGVRLPKEFVSHAVSRTDTSAVAEMPRIDTIEAADIDRAWWAEQRGP